MCYYQNVNNEDSFRSVLHWEKCGEILFFSKILCFLGKCEENLVFLKKFSIFLKSLYSHFEKMWRKYCPFLQNWDFFSKLISLLKFAKLKKTWWFFLKMIILYSNLLKHFQLRTFVTSIFSNFDLFQLRTFPTSNFSTLTLLKSMLL